MRARPLLLGILLLGRAGAVDLAAAPRERAAAARPVAAVVQGPAAGEVTHEAAVVWARCAEPGTLVVARPGAASVEVAVGPATDGAGTAALAALPAATRVDYTVRCRTRDAESPARPGHFRTAPPPDAAARVRIAWGADVGGQNVCRDAGRGWPVFAAIADAAPDLLVTAGDMVYADDACLSVGRYGNAQVPGPPPAEDLAGVRAHWRYLHDDPGFRALLASTAWAATWDDHEVANDFVPGHPLFAAGLRAMLESVPVRPPPDDPTRLWRRIRRGRHLDLFVLDTRQYRDPNAARDDGPRAKTMLGAAQRAWLERELAASDATWKVVVSSVPLAIPTGPPEARDSWAAAGGPTGFARERDEILRWPGAQHAVWLTADVHFATLLVHRLAPGVQVYEAVAGPLGAGFFPRPDLAPGLGSRHAEPVYGPTAVPAAFADALPWFNFGLLDVDAGGRLALELRDATGRRVWRHTLARPAAATPRR